MTWVAVLLTSVLGCAGDGGPETRAADEPGDPFDGSGEPFTVRFETSQGPVHI